MTDPAAVALVMRQRAQALIEKLGPAPDLLGFHLRQALETAIAARSLIKDSQFIIAGQALRDNTDIEKAARDYQVDLVAWQIKRAADIAQKRLDYLDAIKTQQQIDLELEKCTNGLEGSIHWFEYYAWGFDPRPDAPLQVQPFGLFEFQRQYIDWLESLVFERRTSGIVEKARDMGATIGALNWIIKQWLFRPGFAAMLVSATEDLVDSKKDPDTLFEKVRFALKLLPAWMLPQGFNLEKDLTYMNIANPVNGSVITGGAPTGKVGKQRRRSCVLMDEFAAWPQGGYPQHTALSQTSKSLLMLATPEGKQNKYAEIRFSGVVSVFTMDWREHPWKDQRWRDALPYGYIGTAMSEVQIAQEIERNYEASQPGKVFRQWREEYCLITWEELIGFYKQFGLDKFFYRNHLQPEFGYKVPSTWKWCRTHDYGQTAEHPWIVTHAARPKETFPLSDSLFVFSCLRIQPDGSSVGEAYPQIVKVEKDLGWRDELGKVIKPYEFSTNSHEAKDVRRTFANDYGEVWVAWNTEYSLGVPQLQQWFDLIKPNEPNPFRPSLMGRSRIYFVAMPSEYRLMFNEQTNKHFVTPSKTEAGFKLLREELPAYHYPASELGKPPKEMRPHKFLDDTIDTLRAIGTVWGPGVAQRTEHEKLQEQLPEGLQDEQIALKTDFQLDMALLVRDYKLKELKRRQQEEGGHWGDDVVSPNDDVWSDAGKETEWL